MTLIILGHGSFSLLLGGCLSGGSRGETFCLYLDDPTGMTMVFPLLNLAPEAVHQVSRSSKSCFGQSFLERKTVASSMKRDMITLWWMLGASIFRPTSLFVVLQRSVRNPIPSPLIVLQ